MKIGIIIRFHYKEDDEKFPFRFQHFKNNVLPRIRNQSFKDFSINVWCNPWHEQLFKDLGVNTFQGVDKTSYKYFAKKDIYFFHDFITFEETTGLEKFDLQLGLDSDDYIHEDYVKIIVDEVEKHKKKFPNKSLHLCFLPELLRLKTNKVEHLRNYSTEKGSAFMALYQPVKDNYRFIYEESHMSIIRRADIQKVLPKGYCWACAHDFNESTGK